jgi:hypothetical protein
MGRKSWGEHRPNWTKPKRRRPDRLPSFEDMDFAALNELRKHLEAIECRATNRLRRSSSGTSPAC